MRLILGGESSFAAIISRLEKDGRWEAIFRLKSPEIFKWAQSVVENEGVLTQLDKGYPSLLRANLQDSAPLVFYRKGPIPANPWFGVCGSRLAPKENLSFATETGSQIAESGFGLVTGGATGCDQAAEEGALLSCGPVLRFLPQGIPVANEKPGISQLSLSDPREPFSTPLAMERNLLIHASSKRVLVAHARWRSGGAWHGSIDAARRKIGALSVPAFEQEAWATALVALGAQRITVPEELLSGEGQGSAETTIQDKLLFA